MMYSGDGHAACSKHFATLGEPVPEDFNPADHFLDAVSVDYRTPELIETTKARIEKLFAGFEMETKPLLAAPSGDDGEARSRARRAETAFWTPFKLARAHVARTDTGHGHARAEVRDEHVLLSALRHRICAWRGTRSASRTAGILFFQAANEAAVPASASRRSSPAAQGGVAASARRGCTRPCLLRLHSPRHPPSRAVPGILYGTVIYYKTAWRAAITSPTWG